MERSRREGKNWRLAHGELPRGTVTEEPDQGYAVP